MKHSVLSVAIVALLPMTTFGAGLERTPQSVSAFLQDGNYAEFSLNVVTPSIQGVEKDRPVALDDSSETYHTKGLAIKVQATDKVSLGVIYDEPFGVHTKYTGDNIFTGIVNSPLPVASKTTDTGVTTSELEISTRNLTGLVGYQPNDNWNIYGGVAYQELEGELHLRGSAFGVLSGYDLSADKTGGTGFVAGLAYQRPEIALKASVTYRSEIDHDIDALENINAFTKTADSRFTTPQSLNVDFQTGIAKNTLAFANARWVDWSAFKVRPNEFGQLANVVGQRIGKPDGFNLVEFSKDQYALTLGVARKFNERWTGTASVGYDSGAGNPTTVFGAVEGNKNMGLGVQFSPDKNTFISAGVKYLKSGDAKGQIAPQAGTDAYVAEYGDNDAWAYGLKMGYRF